MEGTFHYLAPELIGPWRFGLEDGNPSKKSDIYALAISIYRVLTGIKLYEGMGETKMILGVLEGLRPTLTQKMDLDPETREMVVNCWSSKLEERWEIELVCLELDRAKGVEAMRRELDRGKINWAPVRDSSNRTAYDADDSVSTEGTLVSESSTCCEPTVVAKDSTVSWVSTGDTNTEGGQTSV